MASALEGLKVLDLTRLLPGPLATYILACLGAEVIKVEDTKGGDWMRYAPPQMPDGESPQFKSLNAGKKGIAIDLKMDEGKEIFLKLVKVADVVIEGFRPGVMERLGIGFRVLKAVNPKIILCSITGYGQTGPYAQRPGHDLNYISLSGIMNLMCRGDEAFIPAVQIADISGSLFAVIGVLSGLIWRDKAGEGCHIDLSMVETSMFFIVDALTKFLGTGHEQKPFSDVITGGTIAYNVYKTKDGKFITFGALEPKFWSALSKILGMEGESGMTSTGTRQHEKMREKIAEKNLDEWVEILHQEDVPYEVVKNFREIVDDQHIKAREVFYEGEEMTFLRLPFLAPFTIKLDRSPRLGEHTMEILKNWAGLRDEDIEDLARRGIVKLLKRFNF